MRLSCCLLEFDSPPMDGRDIVIGDCEVTLSMFGGTDTNGLAKVADFDSLALDITVAVKNCSGITNVGHDVCLFRRTFPSGKSNL